MRIAMVGNFGLTGNQTMAARALPLGEALAARGHDVLMALPVRRESDLGEPREHTRVDIRYVRGAGPAGLSYLLQAVFLSWICLRWRPNAVYCFKPIAHSSMVLGVFRILRGLRLFRGLIALDTDDWEGDGGWNEKQPFPVWLKRGVAWQERWSLRSADAVTAASLELVKLAQASSARRVVYVPNCLAELPSEDVPAGEATLWPRRGAGPRVLVYTRFVEFSPERLVDTFAAILDRAPQTTFLVAGLGLSGEEQDVRRLVDQRGLAEQVRVTAAWVRAENKAGYFGAADLALYLLDDNLLNRTKCPVKLLELTAAGVPVVADCVGQAAEYVQDGKTGVLVAAGNVTAMADAAVSLLSDRAGRARMSEAARAVAAERWTWDAWLPEVERALGLSGGTERTR